VEAVQNLLLVQHPAIKVDRFTTTSSDMVQGVQEVRANLPGRDRNWLRIGDNG
jgi:hypothetical protein